MANCLERHPAYSLLTITFLIMCATSGFFKFIYEDSKIDYYKAQIETIKSELENNKAIANVHKAKVEYLESELQKMGVLNKKYFEWLSESKMSNIHFQEKIDGLIIHNYELINNLKNSQGVGSEKTDNQYVLDQIIKIKARSTIINNPSGLTIALLNVSVDGFAKIRLNFSDNTTKIIEENVGYILEYQNKNKNKKYRITIMQVDYVFDYININIKEVQV
ncbi:MAG: hypothetical protein ACRC6R_00620 [Bacteroidales bacterium]